MSRHPWLDEYRAATQQPPPFARQRVWAKVRSPAPAPRARWWVASALAAVTLASVAAWVSQRGEPMPPSRATASWQREGQAVALRDAVFREAPGALVLEQGELGASVWAGPALKVRAAGHDVEIESARVIITVAGNSFVVNPLDGAVRVDGVWVESSAQSRVTAGAWADHLRALEPVEATAKRALQQADRALSAGNVVAAHTALSLADIGATATDELVLFRRGELELRALNSPKQALATFDLGDQRFLHGALAPERALSALEAATVLEDWSEVARRADAFLRAFPESERRSEVQLLRSRALAASR